MTWRDQTGAAWLTDSDGRYWRSAVVPMPPPITLRLGLAVYALVENDDDNPYYFTYIEVPDDDRG